MPRIQVLNRKRSAVNELSYLNGQLKTDCQLSISVQDSGFVQGTTVSEQLRTFGGTLFALEQHFARLQRSLDIVGIQGLDLEDLKTNALAMTSHNHSVMQSGDDLGLTIFVTPGVAPNSSGTDAAHRTVGMFTTPLPFHRWAGKYSTGESLVVSSIRQVPENCWPSELKCRSRMHYFLADQEAQKIHPGARALLLDQDGSVAEASTASIILYRQHEGLVAPLPEKVLPSISVGVLKTIASDLGMAFVHRNISVDDVRSADEILLTSTSPCLLPVTNLDNVAVSGGTPGPIFEQIMNAWNTVAGVDIVAQATQFSVRD